MARSNESLGLAQCRCLEEFPSVPHARVRPAIKRFTLALRPPQGCKSIGSSSFSALSVWLVAWGAVASERGNRQPSIRTNKGLTGPRRLGWLAWYGRLGRYGWLLVLPSRWPLAWPIRVWGAGGTGPTTLESHMRPYPRGLAQQPGEAVQAHRQEAGGGG